MLSLRAVVLLLLPALALAASPPAAQTLTVGDPRLAIEGLGWWKEEPKLQRLPTRVKPAVPPKVWGLSQSAAGVRIRFRTDSINVSLKAKSGTYKPALSPPLGLIGFDLYVDGRYHGSDLPGADGSFKKVWAVGKTPAMREITIYLPFGSHVEIESIDLTDGAAVEPAQPYALPKPVVYYGSSITQGAQASNPGVAFPCILGRWLRADFINLGFSGNGLGEPALAEAVAELDACCYVIDYWANPAPELYEKTFPGFIEIIRAKHPTTPILVTGAYYNPAEIFGSRMGEYQLAKRTLIPALVEKRRQTGDTNIYYVDGLKLIAPDQADALSDARHPNSYGMFLYARGLEPHLRRVLGLEPAPAR